MTAAIAAIAAALGGMITADRSAVLTDTSSSADGVKVDEGESA